MTDRIGWGRVRFGTWHGVRLIEDASGGHARRRLERAAACGGWRLEEWETEEGELVLALFLEEGVGTRELVLLLREAEVSGYLVPLKGTLRAAGGRRRGPTRTNHHTNPVNAGSSRSRLPSGPRHGESEP